MPPEITTALIGLIVTIIAGIGTLVATIFYMVKEFGNIKVEQSKIKTDAEKIKNDAEKQDNDKDKIINTFVVDFNKRLEDKDSEIKELRNSWHNTEVELRERNAKLEGMVEANTQNHNKTQDRWAQERKELIAKIEHLEKEMAELRREKELHIEEIRKIRDERDKYKQQLEDRNRLVLDQSGEIDKLEILLKSCQGEKQEQKDKLSKLEKKITPLKQPEQEPDNEDKEDKKIS